MAKFTVSMKVDGRVDVAVEADNFKEAFEKAKNVIFNPNDIEVIDYNPVNATDESGELKEYE